MINNDDPELFREHKKFIFHFPKSPNSQRKEIKAKISDFRDSLQAIDEKRPVTNKEARKTRCK